MLYNGPVEPSTSKGKRVKEKPEQFHVISITPNQQAALRYCMLNWVQQKMLFFINALKHHNKDEHFAYANESMVDAVMFYDDIAGEWPSATGSALKGPTRFFYFNVRHFTILSQALDLYNKETASFILGESRVRIINAQMKELKRLFFESNKYTYTLSEIKIRTSVKVR